MPNRHSRATLLAAACLAAATLLGVVATPASALEPPRPLPGHRAAFVTETDVRPWRDCLWASASMLLDKWTNGELRVSHERLRRLSGDLQGGSSFAAMRVAFRRLGFDIPLTAGGDSTMTWQGLLARLRSGAGAVVLGDYSKLPRWYGRWDRRFWNGKGKTDNHAVYVERYDAKRGRVWMMDPLGRGSYAGEWISTWSLYRFAWFRGGRVQAIATPTARSAPFKGVSFGDPTLASSALVVSAAWQVHTPRGWRFAGADVHAAVTPAEDPLMAAVLAADAGTRPTAAAPPANPTAREAGGTLTASAPVPSTPGAWMVTLALTDRRFGSQVAAAGPLVAFVPGVRRANLHLHVDDQAPDVGSTVSFSVVVTNSGGIPWADPRQAAAAGGDVTPRATRLVATWILVDSMTGTTASDSVAAGIGDRALRARAFEPLRRIPIDPGETVRVDATIQAPDAPGRWALVIDVIDDVEGSFATAGSRPAVALLEVVTPVPPAAGLDVDQE
jgi:hypothetical protein